MKVVFIAGPFRGPSHWQVELNIRRAEMAAFEVWRRGGAALCPHTNTRYFDGALPDPIWLDGAITLLSRCDAILMTDGWRESAGARAEWAYAQTRQLPFFLPYDANPHVDFGWTALERWLREGPTP